MPMAWPTMAQVEQAAHLQLARWWLLLPPPGSAARGTAAYDTVCYAQAALARRIEQRFYELGGWTREVAAAARQWRSRDE